MKRRRTQAEDAPGMKEIGDQTANPLPDDLKPENQEPDKDAAKFSGDHTQE